MTITSAISSFIRSFNLGDAGPEAINTAKHAFVDTLGVALGAINGDISRILYRYAHDIGGSPEVSVIGGSSKASAETAAMVNGTLCHALDFDDTCRTMLAHASVVLVPTALSIGQKLELSGKDLLEGYIAGFEVAGKIGRALNPGLYDRGWHPTSAIGVMGSCACALKMMGASDAEIRSAFGIVCSEASGIKKNFGSMTKPYHAGSAAAKGVRAAQLAAYGFTGDHDPFDGQFGYFDLYHGVTSVEPWWVTKHLGDPFEILSPGITFKPYPCVAAVHSLIDIALDLRNKHIFEYKDIESVECVMHPRRLPYTSRENVTTGLQGKFSSKYCVSAALVDGAVGLEQFKDDHVKGHEIQKLMLRINVKPMLQSDPLFKDEYGGRVIVYLKGGKVLKGEQAEAKGTPGNPMSEKQFKDKFLNCATLNIPSPDALSLFDTLSNLEAVDSVSRLMGLLQ